MVSGPWILQNQSIFRDTRRENEIRITRTENGFDESRRFLHPIGLQASVAGLVSYFKVDMMDISTICVYELAEHTIQIHPNTVFLTPETTKS
jgi:hypothetical protein